MGGPAIIDGEEHPETDNFLPCQIVINGITYCSAENYFQCAKATNDVDRDRILKSGAGSSAWAVGQKIKIRSDWESVKVQEMYNGNLEKFKQNENLRTPLLSTGNSRIVCKGSTDFWNKWNSLILERIRAELRQNGEEDVRRVNEIRVIMDKYAKEH